MATDEVRTLCIACPEVAHALRKLAQVRLLAPFPARRLCRHSWGPVAKLWGVRSAWPSVPMGLELYAAAT
jgi:hypothetical protein